MIAQIAPLDPNGFTNLNFSALANVPANAPFFPAAYHRGERPAFALAVELADQAVTDFSAAHSLAEARQTLLESLEQTAERIEKVALELEKRFGIAFLGLDFSLAPYPDDCCSLGGAMEQLGVAQLGQSGSLAAAAFVADTLDRGRWKRVGFNGLMLPVLEDSVLARRSQDSLTLERPAALFGGMRHRPGHRAAAGRRQPGTAISRAAGPGGAVRAFGQAPDRPLDAGARQKSRRPDQL